MRADDRVDGPDIKRALVLLIAFLLTVLLLRAEAARGRSAAARAYSSLVQLYLSGNRGCFRSSSQGAWQNLPKRLEIEADFLDLARRPDAAHALRTANFLHEKYANVHFDAVVMIGIAGIPFLLKYRDMIAPGVPVVLSDVTRATYDAMRLPPDITAVINDYNMGKTLELAEHLQPDARRLVVIGGSNSDDRRWWENARKAVEAHNNPKLDNQKLETAYWFDRTYSSLLEDVSDCRTIPSSCFSPCFADSEDKRLIPRDVAAALAKASAAPVYGFFDTYLGSGIVGGYINTYQSIGTTTAAMVFEILSGKDVATSPPRTSPSGGTDFRVDARAMKRWGLKQGNLPPGSTVLFHEPSLWEQNRYLVSATGAVVVLQSLIVAGLLFQRRRRHQAEELARGRARTA